MKLTRKDVNTIKVSMHRSAEDLSSHLGLAKEWVKEKMDEIRETERLKRMVP